MDSVFVMYSVVYLTNFARRYITRTDLLMGGLFVGGFFIYPYLCVLLFI